MGVLFKQENQIKGTCLLISQLIHSNWVWSKQKGSFFFILLKLEIPRRENAPFRAADLCDFGDALRGCCQPRNSVSRSLVVLVRLQLLLSSCLALEGSDRYFTSLTPELSPPKPGELCWLCMWLGGKELVVLFIGAPFQRAKEQTGYLSTKAIISQESCCREQQEPTWLTQRKDFPYLFSFLPVCMSLLNHFSA